jgi:hypothetical protein
VIEGDAIGFAILALFSAVKGVQEYDAPPVAFNCIDCPTHIRAFDGNMEALGKGLTITVTVADCEQPYCEDEKTV